MPSVRSMPDYDPATIVAADGVRLHHELDSPDCPRLTGTALVLIHGFPLDARIWADVGAITGRHVCTLRVSLRGFGPLTDVTPFTIASLAEDVYELLQQTGRVPAVVAGLSMGGYVALALAQAHPEAVAGLGLVDTRADADSTEARRKRDDMIELVRRGGTAAVVEQMWPKLLAAPTYAQRPEVAERLRRIMLDVPPTTIEHACAAMRDRADMTDALATLRVPVTVVVGEEDAVTPPPVARAMAERSADAELVTVSGAGHLAALERPAAVAEALLRLVERSRVRPS